MVFKVYEIFNILSALEKLIKQQTEYPISVAYKLYQLYLELSQIESFIFERIEIVTGKNINAIGINDKEYEIYQAILNSDIDITKFTKISIDDIMNDSAKLTIKDISFLINFINKAK